MVNFKPLKNYMFYLTKKMVSKYNIRGNFLDAGCGRGDVTEFLAKNGFLYGKAIDYSQNAISFAKDYLSKYKNIKVDKKEILEENEKYDFILLLDVLEHCKNDNEILDYLKTLLNPGGFMLISYVTKSKEWRNDDYNYGHLRRYEIENIKKSLEDLEVLEVWDFTFPLFWAMRRIYAPTVKKREELSSEEKTKESSLDYSNFILLNSESESIIWKIISMVNYPFKTLNLGHQSLVLVRRPS